MLPPANRVFGFVVSPIIKVWRYLTGGSWKRALVGVVVMAGVFAVGGFLYAWIGLAQIAASEGHWRITEWFLRFTMRNSVELSAFGIEPPPLDDPALVLKGAGHYATGCEPCHGAPGDVRSPIVLQMTPDPPPLPPKIQKRKPEQLFWIVKHGIKYTAMPGWVALEREDEVWAMVAFLQRMPQLSPEEYRQLAFGTHVENSTKTGSDVAPYFLRPLTEPLGLILANCARCHGFDGAGRGLGAFPILAGQNEEYLFATLLAYAAGERRSGIMQPVAAGLSEETLRALARYYANQSGEAVGPVEAPDALVRGRDIAERGVTEQGIPACVECHGPRPGPRNPVYPNLAGQYADYLMLQLELFKAGKRGGTPYAHIMNHVASRLTQAQIRDLAVYYALLGRKKMDKKQPAWMEEDTLLE